MCGTKIALPEATDRTPIIADVNSPSLLDTEAATELTLSKVGALEPDDAKHLKNLAKGEVVIVPKVLFDSDPFR